jgi:hypothetical protein
LCQAQHGLGKVAATCGVYPAGAETTLPPPPSSAAQLSNEWKEILDETTGKKYYYNAKTGASQWENPNTSDMPPPPPNSTTGSPSLKPDIKWLKFNDPNTKQDYYYNFYTKIDQDEKPDDYTPLPSGWKSEDDNGLMSIKDANGEIQQTQPAKGGNKKRHRGKSKRRYKRRGKYSRRRRI